MTHRSLDWLVNKQEKIENKLANLHLDNGSLVLYDVTSTYLACIIHEKMKKKLKALSHNEYTHILHLTRQSSKPCSSNQGVSNFNLLRRERSKM